jgi:hypothetical protein
MIITQIFNKTEGKKKTSHGHEEEEGMVHRQLSRI